VEVAAAARAAVPAAAADFFILFSHLPPRSFLPGGIFLSSKANNYSHYKSISHSRAAEKLIHNLKFRIQNSKLSADSFPPFLDRLLERSYPFMQLQITNLS